MFTDSATLLACRDSLLLLRDYINAIHNSRVLDAVCNVAGEALIKVEKMVRDLGRVKLWPWPAVQVIDALIQLLTEMLMQVRLEGHYLAAAS